MTTAVTEPLISTKHPDSTGPILYSSKGIPSAQEAIAGGNPAPLTWTKEVRKKFSELPDKVKEISVNGPKNSFETCVKNGSGALERVFKKENWGMRNPFTPFNDLIRHGKNTWVQEMWSPEYFVGCKGDVAEASDTMVRGTVHLGATIYFFTRFILSCLCFNAEGAKDKGELFGKNFLLLLEDIGNLLLIGGKFLINVEILNFVKGMVGAVFSSVSFVGHSASAALTILPALVAWLLQKADIVDTNNKYANALINFFKGNLKEIGKDLISTLSCLGHAIPSWLPLVATIICPPAGIGLYALKILSVGVQFPGVTDVAAYGGTFALLGIDVQEAKKKFKNQAVLEQLIEIGNQEKIDCLEEAEGVSNEDLKKAKGTLNNWIHMKHELNPLKSKEGAVLTAYGVNMVLTVAATVIDVVTHGAASTVLELGSYALAAATGATIRGYGAYRDANSVEIAPVEEPSVEEQPTAV